MEKEINNKQTIKNSITSAIKNKLESIDKDDLDAECIASIVIEIVKSSFREKMPEIIMTITDEIDDHYGGLSYDESCLVNYGTFVVLMLIDDELS